MTATIKKNLKKRSANNKDSGKIVKKAKNISVDSSAEEEEEEESSSDDDLDNIVSTDSEDELDDTNQKGKNTNHDEAENTREDGSSSLSSSSHSEQKKLLKERKLKRSGGEYIAEIKSLWERLRVKNPPMPKNVREKLSNQVWELSKDCISDLVMKHDASRIVQTLVKYSTKDRREKIVESLRGKYYVLATSSYGKYLLVKLLHYGSKNSRQIIIDELHGSLRKLMRHREGAYVIEDLYVLYASQEQRQQMIKEFWGSEYAIFKDSHKSLTIEDACSSSLEKRNIIAKNLVGTITASVEKGSAGFQILHAAMREYVKIANDKEISEFIELLSEHFAELVHTPEGSDVACTLIAKATAKERKGILKNLKDHAEKLIQNEHGNIVFITILMCVDDTVLTFKTFQKTVADKLQEFIVEKYARRPFLYILLGIDGKYFSPIVKKDLDKYIEFSKKTSKKPFEQRRSELLSKFAPIYLNVVSKYYKEILSESMGSQFVSDMLVNDAYYEHLTSSDEKNAKLFSKLLDTIIVYFKGDISEKDHPINNPFSGRLLKSLIQGGKWNNKEKKLIQLSKVQGLGSTFAIKFYEDIIDSSNLLEWCNNPNGSFTVVAIYECLKNHKHGHFLKDLKKIKKDINTDDDSNKGAQLLLKLLK
ncbi:probable Pumilio homology domain family member 6 [Saccharomycodes ludwigii]|uniref:Probable Pumilio homology domain family member 6 n=1 Tax=Saccharomycodes ludwigii TaxID=36035 RepID=A0A376B9S1_9ASCO|nr:hypothetical protein SCDLUD_002569 [Saccharomycodes ludwigii]KAH3901093.1 hypothetical protein SCDLUD_002569 [Saccharomycodes ludwigii]SSD61433.1 probable Pumilio homology domain family member 6 [Saccharomycodes ludwigii]